MTERARLWVFRTVTVVAVPILMLLAFEGLLRLVGFGHSSALTVPCTVQGRDAFCDNDRFTWQFFPPGAFRLPPAFAIPAEKGPNTYRIFIVGESAAQGDPEPAYSFGRYLEVMLRDRFPTMRFEVINTGITAINSHVLLPAVRDLAKRDGDLFIFYIGNNEVVGPYGPGTMLTTRGLSLPLVRAAIYVNSTRLGQLIGAVLKPSTKDESTWRGMEMFLKQRIPADAPAMETVYENFRSNLRDIIGAARSSGADVLVSTVAVNLKDSAPFASLHRAKLAPQDRKRWEKHVSEGAQLEAAGRQEEALEQYLAAAAVDDLHAELQYRIARNEWARGRFEAARKCYARARDLDALRFRADDKINEIIRSVARKAGPDVKLIDAEHEFADESAQGIPGRTLFYEHVHMKPRGNYLLARTLFPHVVSLLPEKVRRSAGAAGPLQEPEAERLLALTPHDRRRVARLATEWLTQPPFTARIDNDEQREALKREAEGEDNREEIDAAYRAAIAKAPEDRWLHFNYGLFLEMHAPAKAAKSFQRALELLPGNYVARERLASTLARLGRYEEAVAQCRELLRKMPYHPAAHLTLAYAQARLGLFDESIASYQRAIELHPAYALDAHTNVGLIRLHQGKFEQAAASLAKAIDADKTQSRTPILRSKLSFALEKLGRHAEARRVLEGGRSIREVPDLR